MKRFSRTGSGKIVRAKAFRRHILTKKSRSRKRSLRETAVLATGDARRLRRMLS